MHLKIIMLYLPFVDDTNILSEILNLATITAYNKKSFFFLWCYVQFENHEVEFCLYNWKERIPFARFVTLKTQHELYLNQETNESYFFKRKSVEFGKKIFNNFFFHPGCFVWVILNKKSFNILETSRYIWIFEQLMVLSFYSVTICE